MAMKNNKKRICMTLLSIIVGLVIFSIIFTRKEKIGLFFDKLGVFHNSFLIEVDKSISTNDLYIYWFGETDYTNDREYNKILVYHRNFQSDILDSYGKNRFVLVYKEITYEKIGIFKTHPYSKYNYNIKIKEEKNNIIINWNIENWYEQGLTGSDTILVESNVIK